MSDLEEVKTVLGAAAGHVKTLALILENQLDREVNLAAAVDHLSQALDHLAAAVDGLEQRVAILEAKLGSGPGEPVN